MNNVDNSPKYYHATKNTMLAAGLAAIGVPFFDDPYEKIKIKGEELWVWRFKTQTPCGTYTTSKLMDWWHDDDWFSENYPKHPWALIISAILTKDYLVKQMKAQPTKVAIKKKSKTWVVYENSELYKKLTKELQ
jgi:hypothetical protein